MEQALIRIKYYQTDNQRLRSQLWTQSQKLPSHKSLNMWASRKVWYLQEQVSKMIISGSLSMISNRLHPTCNCKILLMIKLRYKVKILYPRHHKVNLRVWQRSFQIAFLRQTKISPERNQQQLWILMTRILSWHRVRYLKRRSPSRHQARLKSHFQRLQSFHRGLSQLLSVLNLQDAAEIVANLLQIKMTLSLWKA